MQKRIVVFGAHPDDVEIGMGGTIKRLTSHGHEVTTCIAAIPDNRELRYKESRRAAELLGTADLRTLPLSIEELGYNRKTIMLVDQIIKEVKPDAVFTHWMHDSHQDHVNVTRCVVAATRKNNFHVFMYENTIPGGLTEGAFRAQYFIDISSTIKTKIEAIEAHASQIRRNGEWWVQGIYGRAMYRGYQIHTKFAEAFEVVKINNDIQFFSFAAEPETQTREREEPQFAEIIAAQTSEEIRI